MRDARNEVAGPYTAAPARSRGLWFALLAAPIAWVVQGMVAWATDAHSCGDGARGASSLPPAGVRALDVGLCVVAGVIAVVAMLIAIERRRALRADATTRLQTGRTKFIATAALFVSVCFFAGILLTGFAASMLDLCATMR